LISEKINSTSSGSAGRMRGGSDKARDDTGAAR
jgi:hypothetical protein